MTDAIETVVVAARPPTLLEIDAWVKDTRAAMDRGVSFGDSVLLTALDHLEVLLSRQPSAVSRQPQRERPTREQQREVYPNLSWYEDDPPPVGKWVRQGFRVGVVIGAGSENGEPWLERWWRIQDDVGEVWFVYPPACEPMIDSGSFVCKSVKP